MDLPIKLLNPLATLPHYAHTTDAGLDLCSVEECTIAGGARWLVGTGISLAIPDGYVGLVWDKSGIATKIGVTTLAGVIDSGYRGEIKIALYNTGSENYIIKSGQKIAQLLIQPIVQPNIIETDNLSVTDRNDHGFGSTGL
ncbi:MAG: dUTP diphosphatase [Patescibacteria group bacterium]|jgi:dUTP pyrophosphatase